MGEPLDNDDLAAVTEEENFVTARESDLAVLVIVNWYTQLNVCGMVKAGFLTKQKEGQLQFLCTELGVDVSCPPVGRKSPYVTLLQDIGQKCGCMG